MKQSFTAERGAAICLKACVDQIEAGCAKVMATDDLNGPHGLRIGLRRLRTALRLFRHTLDGPRTRALAEQAKWLGQEVGKTRDLEVVLFEIFEPAVLKDGGDTGTHPLLQAVRVAQKRERSRLRKLLGGQRASRFLTGLQAYVAHRGWLLPDDIGQTERLAKPLGDVGRRALKDRWKITILKAGDLERLSVTESHELRKEMKKLRYSVDFLAPLYPAERVEPFVKRLKSLQTVFGSWNDAAVAKRIFEAAIGQDKPEQSDQEVIARAVDDLQVQAAAKLASAQENWRKLLACKTPWA